MATTRQAAWLPPSLRSLRPARSGTNGDLFYNNARRKVGLVGYWDVVAFDEIGGMKVGDPDVMQIMKDYAANGRFSRGVTQIIAEASLVFVGNLNQPVESLVANTATDLFQPLPKEFDLALIDRLHFYLPGREVPKNSTDILTTHYGLLTPLLGAGTRGGRFSSQNLGGKAVRDADSFIYASNTHPAVDIAKRKLDVYLVFRSFLAKCVGVSACTNMYEGGQGPSRLRSRGRSIGM